MISQNSTGKLEDVRVRVCFNCREYHLIDTSDYKSIQLLHSFEEKHRGHRTQVVNLEELFNNALSISKYLET